MSVKMWRKAESVGLDMCIEASVRRSAGCQPCCHRKAEMPFLLTCQKPHTLILSTYNAFTTRIFMLFLSGAPVIVYMITANLEPGIFRRYYE